MPYGAAGDVENHSLLRKEISWKGCLWQWFVHYNKVYILVFIICCAWVAQVLQNMMVLDAMRPTHYFHMDRVLCTDALALTGIINGIAAGFALVCWKGLEARTRATHSDSSEVVVGTVFTWHQLGLFVVSGICEGLERGLANLALKHIGISLRTMLSSSGIFFTFIFTALFALEPLEIRRICAVLVLVVGGVVQGFGMKASHVSVFGICLVIISVIAGALRWSIINLAMSLSPKGAPKMTVSDKFKILTFTKPFDCVLCICVSLALKHHEWSAPEAELVKMWILMGLNILAAVFFELVVIQYTSAVANGILLIIGTIWVMLSGVYFNRERTSEWQYIGFGICIFGSIVYTTAAYRPFKEAAALSDNGNAAEVEKLSLNSNSISSKKITQ